MQVRLIIVANRLPVSVEQTEAGLTYQPSPGGMAAALSPILNSPEALWVGYTGVGRRLTAAELEQLQLPQQLVPVNLAKELYRKYYYGFSNGSLWPTFHGFKPKRVFDQEDWEAVLTVTQRFAEIVMETVRPGDLIWIHDFHLIMLPMVLRQLGCKNRIGYFLHVPFADGGLFGALPHSRQMAASLAAADLCGFQTEQDAARFRQYLTGAIGGSEAPPRVGVFPVGIGYEVYAQAHSRPTVAKRVEALDRVLGGKRVVFSMSRLDYTKGIIEQLRAMEVLLADWPERSRVVYKLVVAPSREDLTEYSELKEQIAATVKEINDRLGTADWQPIDYDYRNYAFDEVASWYIRADVMLVAPLIDGMNLIAKEYVAAKPGNRGVLVLSKFAGAAQQLEEALLVDPTDVSALARTIEQALTMPLDERRQRLVALRRNVRLEDAARWGRLFVAALEGNPGVG